MRKPRLTVPGYPHHVIVRGNNRRRLFSYRDDYWCYLRFLAQGLARHPVALHAMTLMTNHVHLLLTPSTDVALTKLMHYTGMRYSRCRNDRRGASGKLFEERFHSFPVLSDGQLAVVTAYIELNPVRAGMRPHALGRRFSTHGLHVGRADRSDVPRGIWTPSAWYLSLGATDGERAARYRQWIEDCQRFERRPENFTIIEALEIITTGRDHRLRRPSEQRAA